MPQSFSPIPSPQPSVMLLRSFSRFSSGCRSLATRKNLLRSKHRTRSSVNFLKIFSILDHPATLLMGCKRGLIFIYIYIKLSISTRHHPQKSSVSAPGHLLTQGTLSTSPCHRDAKLHLLHLLNFCLTFLVTSMICYDMLCLNFVYIPSEKKISNIYLFHGSCFTERAYLNRSSNIRHPKAPSFHLFSSIFHRFSSCPPYIHHLSPPIPCPPMATCQLDGGEPLSIAAAVADHTAAFADLEALAADTRAQLEAWERGIWWLVNLDDLADF